MVSAQERAGNCRQWSLPAPPASKISTCIYPKNLQKSSKISTYIYQKICTCIYSKVSTCIYPKISTYIYKKISTYIFPKNLHLHLPKNLHMNQNIEKVAGDCACVVKYMTTFLLHQKNSFLQLSKTLHLHQPKQLHLHKILKIFIHKPPHQDPLPLQFVYFQP